MSEFEIEWYLAAVAISYVTLSVVTAAALREFSFRHTLFYLVMSILGVWGSVLFSDVRMYGAMLLVWMAPAISLLFYGESPRLGLDFGKSPRSWHLRLP